MGLSHIKVARVEIPVDAQQSFKVRAISATDVAMIVGRYGPQCSMALARIMETRKLTGQIDNRSVQDALGMVLPEFPQLFAALIALASDDFTDEGVSVAGQLPVTVQTQALENVFALTFESEGSLKKFAESLIRMVEGVVGALENMMTPSSDGTGLSDDK